MGDENTYKVTLEAETDGFKKKIKDVESDTKKFGETVKENLRLKLDEYGKKIGDEVKNAYRNFTNTVKRSYGLDKTSDFNISTDYDKQITLLEGKINDLISNIEKLKEASKDVDNKQQILEAEAELEKLNIQIKGLYDKRIDILDWDQTEAYIDNLYKKLEDLKTIQQSLASGSNEFAGVSLNAVNKAIDRVNFQIKTAEDTLVEFNDEGKKTNNIFGGLGKVVSKGFSDTTRSIKRLALSMVGVHSAYYVLSRAISTYQQYDVETTNKIKSAWAGLGAFLAPIVQTIGTLVQKAVGYLNVFITALTGTNYIQKANDAYKYSQSVKNIGKSAKEATKSLTAMDEITNLQDNSGSGGDTGVPDFNPFEALQQVELNQEWVKKIQEIGEALRPVYNTIKDIITWCIQHPNVIAGVIGGVALLSMLAKVIGYAGAGTLIGTGLAGVLGVLLAIVSLGIITIGIKVIYDDLKGLKKATKKIEDGWDELIKKVEVLQQYLDDWYKKYDKNNKEQRKQMDKNQEKAKKYIKDMEKLKKEMSNWGPVQTATNMLSGTYKNYSKAYYEAYSNSQAYLEGQKKLYEQGKLTDDQARTYEQLIKDQNNALRGASTMMDVGKNKTKELGNSFKTTSTQVKNMKTNTDDLKTSVDKVPGYKQINISANTAGARDSVNRFINDLNRLNLNKPAIKIGVAMGSGMASIIRNLPSYDVGTPFVPEDGLAMIHKGERIIPAEYNNESLFNNRSSETTNALLVELIQAVEESSDKVPVFNINGKEFAKATYEDYRSEENRLNSNNIVRRA